MCKSRTQIKQITNLIKSVKIFLTKAKCTVNMHGGQSKRRPKTWRSRQGLRLDLKVWVCKGKKKMVVGKFKGLCTKYRPGGQNLDVYLQIWVFKTLPTQLAG